MRVIFVTLILNSIFAACSAANFQGSIAVPVPARRTAEAVSTQTAAPPIVINSSPIPSEIPQPGGGPQPTIQGTPVVLIPVPGTTQPPIVITTAPTLVPTVIPTVVITVPPTPSPLTITNCSSSDVVRMDYRDDGDPAGWNRHDGWSITGWGCGAGKVITHVDPLGAIRCCSVVDLNNQPITFAQVSPPEGAALSSFACPANQAIVSARVRADVKINSLTKFQVLGFGCAPLPTGTFFSESYSDAECVSGVMTAIQFNGSVFDANNRGAPSATCKKLKKNP